MPYRDGDEVTTFQNVRVIDTRPLEPSQKADGTWGPSQEKSVKCRFEDGKERFVSRSQVPSWQTFPDDGQPFELEVSAWMVDRWVEADSAPRQVVKIPDVVVLRGSAKAIQVRLPDGSETWVPFKGIDEDSPVHGDGDRGELWVQPWCAKMKGWGAAASDSRQEPLLGGGYPAGYESGPGRAEPGGGAPASGIAADARYGAIPDDDDIPF